MRNGGGEAGIPAAALVPVDTLGVWFFHLGFGFLLFGGLVGGFGLGVWFGTTCLQGLHGVQAGPSTGLSM